MKSKRVFSLFGVLFFSLSIIAIAEANVPIQIMPNHFQTVYSNSMLINLTTEALNHDNINIDEQSNYQSVKVQLLFTRQFTPYLLVHLMSRYFLSYTLIRINLTKEGSIIYPIQQNYQLSDDDFAVEQGYMNSGQSICPAEYQTGNAYIAMGGEE